MKGKTYSWLVVWLLCGVAFLNYMDRQMLATMRQPMMQTFPELEISANFGRLMAIFLWIYALMSPVSGLIADRVNRKWLIVGSLFVWSAVTMLMGFTTNFNYLFILRGIMGVSEALYMPAGLALIVDYHQGRTRSLAVGVHMTGIYLGQAFGGFGSVAATHFSWQTTFHAFGSIGIAYSLILVFILKERRNDEDLKETDGTDVQALTLAVKGMGTLLKKATFWVILFYFAAPSLPGWAVKNWLPTLISTNLHIKMDYAGPIATITLSLSSLLGVVAGGIISDKWVHRNFKGRINTGAIGLGCTIPSLFLIGLGGHIVPVIIGAIGFGVGFGIFDVNNMPILCQFVTPRQRATGYGLMNLAGISAGAFITELFGEAADSGTLGRDFAILSVVVLAAIILVLAALKPKTTNKMACMKAPGREP